MMNYIQLKKSWLIWRKAVRNNFRWTSKALQDLISIKEYIEPDNPKAAVDLTKKIVLKIVEQLTKFQNIGKAGRIHGTRELIIPNTPYIAVYRVKAGSVEVLRVLHTSIKWPDNIDRL
jgi:toxin ParE1/3/4